MKKLKLKALEYGAIEILTREQLKKILGGDDFGSGGSGSNGSGGNGSGGSLCMGSAVPIPNTACVTPKSGPLPCSTGGGTAVSYGQCPSGKVCCYTL